VSSLHTATFASAHLLWYQQIAPIIQLSVAALVIRSNAAQSLFDTCAAIKIDRSLAITGRYGFKLTLPFEKQSAMPSRASRLSRLVG
jgi:hypothetical protein